MPVTRAYILMFVLGCLMAAGGQDIVEMKDGRIVRGTVLKQDDVELTIRARIGSIESVVTFQMEAVRSVTLAPVAPPEEPPPAAADPEPPAAEPPASELPPAAEPLPPDDPIAGAGYLSVPMKGSFGQEIQADAFRHILERAKAHEGVEHIVIELDSPGGQLEAAKEIGALILEHGDRFRFHVLVERGLSASIWVVFACDTICMLPRSTLGAAVPFFRVESGAEAVDAKMVSAIIAELRATAESKGHPTALVDPMIQSGATLVAWRDGAGGVSFGPYATGGVRPSDILLQVGWKEILTLTAGEAEAVGLAMAADCDAAGLGARLGVPAWTSAGDYGFEEMVGAGTRHGEWVVEQEGIGQRLEELTEEFVERADGAGSAFKNHIQGQVFYYHSSTGALTRKSLSRWKSAIRQAMLQLDKASDLLAEIRQVKEQLDGKKSMYEVDEKLLGAAEKELAEAREQLARMRKWKDAYDIRPYVRGIARIQPNRR